MVPGAPVIYAITHLPSGRRYVGITGNLSKRRSEHVAKLGAGRHHIPHMQADFNSDGVGAFIIEVLDNELSFERELYWIRRVSPELRYNLTPRDDVGAADFAAEQAKGTTDRALLAALRLHDVR